MGSVWDALGAVFTAVRACLEVITTNLTPKSLKKSKLPPNRLVRSPRGSEHITRKLSAWRSYLRHAMHAIHTGLHPYSHPKLVSSHLRRHSRRVNCVSVLHYSLVQPSLLITVGPAGSNTVFRVSAVTAAGAHACSAAPPLASSGDSPPSNRRSTRYADGRQIGR